MSFFLKKWYPRLFAKPGFSKINMAMVRYGLRGLGILNYSSHNLTGEAHFLSWLIKNHRPTIIFDVGANKGDYVNLCRKFGFTGHLYGFEPNPVSFEALKIKEDSKNSFFNIGFSDTQGSLELFYESDNESSTHATIYKDSIHNKKNISSIKIELQTLDEFAKAHDIDHIDLLKIDTEGNEYKILLGAKNLLEEGKIRAIQFEITGINVVSRVFFKDFFDMLSPNYRLYRLLPSSFLPLDKYEEPLFLEMFAYQNIIAIKK